MAVLSDASQQAASAPVEPMAVFSDASLQAAVADLRRQIEGIALHRRCLLRLRDDRRPSSSSSSSSSSSAAAAAAADDDGGEGGRNAVQIFVRTLSHGTLVVRAPASATVAALHSRVERATGVPSSDVRFLHGGRQLSPDATLAGAGVVSGDTVHLSARLLSTRRPLAWHLATAITATDNDDSGPAFSDAFSRLADDPDIGGDFDDLYHSGIVAALVRLYNNSTCPDVRRAAHSVIRKFVRGPGPAPFIFLHQLAAAPAAADTDDELYRESRSVVLDLLKKLGAPFSLKALIPLITRTAAVVLENLTILLDDAPPPFPPPFPPPPPPPIFLDRLSDLVSLLQEALTASHCADRSLTGLLSLITDGCFQVFLRFLTKLMDAFVTILSAVGRALKQQAGRPGRQQQKLSLLHRTIEILTIVNNFAEIFPDFRPVLRATLSTATEPLDLLLRNAGWSNTLHWFLKCKDVVLSFEARRNVALMLLPRVADWALYEGHEILIDRSNLLADSFEFISRASPSDLRYGLITEFMNELADGPGVTREWFCLVCREIFNPENVLFLPCPGDRRRFFPNPASSADSMKLEYFKFSGRLIALALMSKVQVGITFDRTFFLQLAGKPVTVEDIKDADPFLYLSCKWILDMDPDLVDSDTLSLTFSRDVKVLGSIKNVELCTGGKDRVVNSRNRETYIDALVQHSFVTSVACQVEQFASGFADILYDRTHGQLFFDCLELEDLDLLLRGSDGAISLTDWKEHTKYEYYKKEDDQIQWFWKIVEEMSDEQQRLLLFFWTAVKYLPAKGFIGLNSKLKIHRASSPNTALPVSQTCFYRLSIPAYNSESTMRDRLHFIIQEHVSCSFGMA